ncbi:hypothetical protein BDA99DRAFT_519710 [Phascolomyces articulosus]|uniref:F-box domain-containing protein n=1 Tax=Phascolomyces articulosus TaxID=60185 RepID=A0AAD5JTM3_9FUNG|nr:hypothetical protein BDA99DRAFT_519710 [Phascolomyces articulosus]
MTGTTTVMERPRRSAAVRANQRVQYNKRASEERQAAKVQRQQQKEAAAAAKVEKQQRREAAAKEAKEKVVAQKRQRKEQDQDGDMAAGSNYSSPPKKKKAAVTTTTKVKRQRKKNDKISEENNEQQQRDPQQPVSHLYDISIEVWELIFQHLYPSELATLAQINDHFKAIVTYMPIWKSICLKASLPDPKIRGHCKTFYQVVIKHSYRVCEKCHAYCAKSGSSASLPVHMEEQKKDINMCLACRKSHFLTYPEQDPPDHADEEQSQVEEEQQQRHRRRRTRITKSTGMSFFRLNEFDMDNINYIPVRNPYYRNAPPMRLYESSEVHSYARRVHGGDVGIEAARSKSRNMIATRQRNLQARRERERQERDAREKDLNTQFETAKIENTLVGQLAHQYVESNIGSVEVCITMARQRIQRQNDLKQAIEAVGYPYDSSSNTTEMYIHQPTSFTLEEAVKRLVQEAIQKRLREERRLALKQALQQHNMELNDRSSFCQNYITSGEPILDHVIQTLVERRWFMDHTIFGTMGRNQYYNYSTDWYFEREKFLDRSQNSKYYALKEYLKARLTSDKYYQSIKEEDENATAAARPPASLWSQIGKMMPDIWKEVACDYLGMGFFAQEQKLVSALAMDPTELAILVPDNQVIQLVDDGFNIKISAMQEQQQQIQQEASSSSKQSKKKQKRVQRPPTPPAFPISFSQAMHQSLGDDFTSFFTMARGRLVTKIKDAYIRKAAKELPALIKTFIEGCKVDPSLNRTTFQQQKAQFIQEKLPMLSQETNIHSSYLISLLDVMDPWSYPYIHYHNQHMRLT